MRNFFLVLIALLTVGIVNAQELNCQITVNSDRISGSNKQVYKTLQTALSEFVNQTKWTAYKVLPQEKINCAFTIIVNKQPASNRFEASIQIQASRPVYGTSYESPILNIKDNDFNFRYSEFEPLKYNKVSFESNLVSTLVYYINIILGVDADTFALKGGDPYYTKAKDVMLLAQQSGTAGWIDEPGTQNRFTLIDNLTAEKLTIFRNIVYDYHRLGMDFLSTKKQEAKATIENALINLGTLYNKTISNNLIRIFMDAKSDEIAAIFSDGQRSPKSNQLQEVLQKISPTNRSKWQKIK